MWHKAENLLCTQGQVIEGPTSSSNTRCYVVASNSSDRPHIIKQGKPGQFSCESSCLMWQSSKICAHCIAAAEYSHQLEEFLAWYKSSKSKPNLCRLSKVDMPKGRGRKGDKPPRKRKKGSATCFALVDRQATISRADQNVSDVPMLSASSSSTDSLHHLLHLHLLTHGCTHQLRANSHVTIHLCKIIFLWVCSLHILKLDIKHFILHLRCINHRVLHHLCLKYTSHRVQCHVSQVPAYSHKAILFCPFHKWEYSYMPRM